MSAFSNLSVIAHELHAEIQAFDARVAAKFREFYAALGGDASALEHEAAATATQVAHDAEVAAKPVIAEAELNLVKVAEQAAATVAADVTKTAGA